MSLPNSPNARPDGAPDADASSPVPPGSSPELPDALRPEKVDVSALENLNELKSASPSEGSGVSGKAGPRPAV